MIYMAHIGVLAHYGFSHIACIASLGRELQSRGHHLTFFNIPDTKAKILAEGMEFCSIGELDYPPGSLAWFSKQMDIEGKRPTIKSRIETILKDAAMICRDAPQAIKEAGIDLLLVDQCHHAGGTVAEFLDIPFINISNAVAQNRDIKVPPATLPWNYEDVWLAHLRNYIGYSLIDWFSRPIVDFYAQQRREWKLPKHSILDETFSSLAQICQLPAEFDFPRNSLPICFHYTGPLRTPLPQSIPFPFEKLTGQPLIYVALGTVFGDRQDIFHCIAEACADLDVQLVISLGKASKVDNFPALPGNPLVVEYAPQVELLAKAKLTINHAGLNTVLDALAQGVPTVAIPIDYDNPGVAARLLWTGAGEVVPLKQLNIPLLRAKVEKVLTQKSYQENATRLKKSIRQAGGVMRAADIVEQVIATGKPVLSKT